MPGTYFILITFVGFALVFLRLVHENKNASGIAAWEKCAGLIAVILALLIILTPEFAALGLIGDSAFFDLLVLLLSLQIQSIATVVRTRLVNNLRRWLEWFFAPRYSYLLWLSAYGAIVAAVSHIQKLAHRIWS